MRKLILISISGHDRPAITSSITRLLEEYDVLIRDIGQAVIHESLSLGMLIETVAGPQEVLLEQKLVALVESLGLRVRLQEIPEASYDEWVTQQGKQRHIITLLARQITAEQICALTTTLAQSGLNIDSISRLSGRVDLHRSQNRTKACVEFSARGRPDELTQLRARLADLASRLDVDIAFQEDNMYRRTRRLVCFDMDSTLIETEVIDELARAAGVGDAVSAITEAAMRGDLDFNESFARRLGMLKGLSEAVLMDIAQKLPITEGAENLIATLRKLGYKTAILSGGFDYFGKYLQKKLGIDYVYANQLAIRDGHLTGEVIGEVVNGERKAELLKQLAEKENIRLEQVVAVGDGANDLQMLGIAGLGIAFRAKPLVMAEANHAISTLGLDAILYLMGYRDRELGH